METPSQERLPSASDAVDFCSSSCFSGGFWYTKALLLSVSRLGAADVSRACFASQISCSVRVVALSLARRVHILLTMRPVFVMPCAAWSSLTARSTHPARSDAELELGRSWRLKETVADLETPRAAWRGNLNMVTTVPGNGECLSIMRSWKGS